MDNLILYALAHRGEGGGGGDRWARLVNAGYDYNEVQAEVNRLLRW